MRRTALVVLVLVAAAPSGSGQQPPATSGSRLLVVASDLHLGPGRDPQTARWLAVEDFRWQDDFASFLRAVNEAGKGTTDLVLNGDTFELWQSGADCRQPEPGQGCSEQESLQRLDRVLAAHDAELAALGAFARSGTNRVVLVPGDHDAALLFPSVAGRVIAALQATGRVEVAARGFWRSADGVVHVEHGHQQAGDPYAVARWPQPFVERSGTTYLERSPGEQLVQTYYNDFEPRYPILDNVAQEGAGLKYLAAADASAVPQDRVGALLNFFLARPTWQQFRLELDGGDVQPPEWDLAAVRSRGAVLLVESLLPDDHFRALADRAVRENRITLDPASVSDEALNTLCDYRAALRRSRRRLERSMTQAATVGPVLAECPRTPSTRGSVFDYFWRSRDVQFTRRLEQVRAAVGGAGAARPIGVLVQGHTHLAAAALPTGRGEGSPVLLNSGAWQRTVTPFQIEETLRDRGWSEAELLQRLQPEDLPACYGVVWIEPYSDKPNPRVRFWRADGRWGTLPRDAAGLANACGGGGPAA